MELDKRFEYVELAQTFLQGMTSADLFLKTFLLKRKTDLTQWSSTPYNYLLWFEKALTDGQSHPNGLDYWLRAALPALMSELNFSLEEINIRNDFYNLWNGGEYFVPDQIQEVKNWKKLTVFQAAKELQVMELIMADIFVWGTFDYSSFIKKVLTFFSGETLFWVYIADPDNCYSCIDSIFKAHLSMDALNQLRLFNNRPAPEGGTNTLVLTSNSLKWLLIHEPRGEAEDFLITLRTDSSLIDDFREMVMAD